MQYLLLIYEDEAGYEKGEQSPAFKTIYERHMKFSAELRERGVAQGGAGLKSVNTATTVRTAGGQQSVHDGPFAETREQLGGYYLIDVPDLDAAIAIARDLPLRANGSVEIRPLMSM
jgi:hypothetical protein